MPNKERLVDLVGLGLARPTGLADLANIPPTFPPSPPTVPSNTATSPPTPPTTHPSTPRRDVRPVVMRHTRLEPRPGLRPTLRLRGELLVVQTTLIGIDEDLVGVGNRGEALGCAR